MVPVHAMPVEHSEKLSGSTEGMNEEGVLIDLIEFIDWNAWFCSAEGLSNFNIAVYMLGRKEQIVILLGERELYK